jgi:nickel/cobalt exporter
MLWAHLPWTLLIAAIGIGATHTLLGPDHYLPFIMLARARGWSRSRTVVITAVCGVGHVGSSVLLGTLGIAFGLAIGHLRMAESGRGDVAAWAMVAFGAAYALWGVRHAMRTRKGLEPHSHDGGVHIHSHGVRPHHHDHVEIGANTTFWTLFIIFVLGPCEPLIPLFALPASRGQWGAAALTAVVFGVVTLVCMVAVTLAGLEGVKLVRVRALERWAHVAAGSIIAAAGLSVIYLGL